MNVKIMTTIAERETGTTPLTDGGPIRLQPTTNGMRQLLLNELAKEYNKLGRDALSTEYQLILRDGDTWTDRMNRLFHALIRDILNAGATQYWSIIQRAPDDFGSCKNWVKVQFGDAEIKTDGMLAWVESWTDFNKKRACQTIDNVLQYMSEQGIDIDAHMTELKSLEKEPKGGR